MEKCPRCKKKGIKTLQRLTIWDFSDSIECEKCRKRVGFSKKLGPLNAVIVLSVLVLAIWFREPIELFLAGFLVILIGFLIIIFKVFGLVPKNQKK